MGSPGDAFDVIGRDLASLKFSLVEDVYDEQAFGSRYAIYRRGNTDVRLIWDGKEEWLLLETGNAAKNVWSQLRVERIGRDTANPKNIAALQAALGQVK